MVTKKKATKKKATRKKPAQIPEGYKEIWNNDYYDLTEQQRIFMVEAWIQSQADYELGKVSKALKPPYFQEHQRDIVRAEEEKRRAKHRKQLEKEEKARVEKEEKEKSDKQRRLVEAIKKWNEERLIKLNDEEKLKIENDQLKIDKVDLEIQLTKKEIEALNDKLENLETRKKNLLHEQETTGDKIQDKYEINLEDYAVDAVSGVCVRNPLLKFPYSIDNLPPEDPEPIV